VRYICAATALFWRKRRKNNVRISYLYRSDVQLRPILPDILQWQWKNKVIFIASGSYTGTYPNQSQEKARIILDMDLFQVCLS